MTYFENDNGDKIELSDDFSLTKSAANLFDFKIKGNTSITFQVPNNSGFKKAFGYYTPLQNPSAGFMAQYFNLVKNGTVIDRGKLILEREDKEFLYFFFASGNSNWIIEVPDISIRDLDYEDFALTRSGMSSYWIDPYTYRAATSGFCFPFVDWGLQGNKAYRGDISAFPSYYIDNYDVSRAYTNGYITSGYNLPEFYPCVFLKSVMQYIFKISQLKIGGDILNDAVYNQMIITPDNGLIKRAEKFLTDRKAKIFNSANSSFASFPAKINFDSVLENGALSCWNSSSQKYTANKPCIYNIYCSLKLSVSIFSIFKVYKNGSLAVSFSPQFYFQSFQNYTDSADVQSNDNQFALMYLPLVTGDYLEFYMDFAGVNKGSFTPAGSFPGGSTIADHWTIAANGTCGGVNVFTGDIIQARKTGAGTGTSQDWCICHISSGINVLLNSSVSVQPEEYPYQTPSSPSDTLRASDILPDMKLIELIKFVSQYFCAPPTFDIQTQTVIFNKLDNFDYTKAIDWSQYLQKLENNYQIQTAQYNYIRFKEIDDPYLKALNSGRDVKYGDIMIQGQSSTKITNDIYQFPFGSAIDRKEKNGYLTTFIPITELEFDGQPIAINSTQDNTNTYVQFNLSNNTDITSADNQLVLIYATGIYDGFANGSFFSKTDPFTSYSNNTFNCNDLKFTANVKGYIQKLKFSFKSNQSRILFFTGEQNFSSINSGTNESSIILNGRGGSHIPATSIPTVVSSMGYGYFSKPFNNYSVANFRQGLNLDYFISGYNDVPRRFDSFKNLSRILNAPYIKAWFFLPELVFAAFNMDKFVFIIAKDQQKYYYVDSIENYKDSKTLVQVNMLLLI